MSKKRLFVVDLNKIQDFNLTLEEFLILYVFINNSNPLTIVNQMLNSHAIEWDKQGHYKIIDEELWKLMQSARTDNFDNHQAKRCQEIAQAIIPLFPKGIKPGTTSSWRISEVATTLRLKTLEQKSGIKLNLDDVVKATKLYIDTYKSDQQTMRTLEYFIWKNEIKNGEVEFKSDLLTFIDRINNGDDVNIPIVEDWVSELL